ncbi:MAG: N-acetylneuraminate synthase [bacterium]
MKKVFIIAEAGVNHNGSVELAKKMIDVASDAAVDAVKFQTFKSEQGISKYAPKAEYQKKSTGNNETQLEMVKKLEFGEVAHQELIAHCKKREIKFMSTPFDDESVDLLQRLGLDTFKIGSGEITRLPLLRKIGSLRKKVILSTGMANLKEIADAVDILIKAGTGAEFITILHCNTEYPTLMEDVNLRAMQTIAAAFPNTPVGYSDHTLGIEVAIAAVAMGAVVIEKHFTLDKNMAGPDHQASLEPDELKAMVQSIRNIEKALGNGIKKPSASEQRNIPIVRRSIVAAKDIRQGEIFSEENLGIKRPGTGISPMLWYEIIGEKAKYSFKEDELIKR